MATLLSVLVHAGRDRPNFWERTRSYSPPTILNRIADFNQCVSRIFTRRSRAFLDEARDRVPDDILHKARHDYTALTSKGGCSRRSHQDSRGRDWGCHEDTWRSNRQRSKRSKQDSAQALPEWQQLDQVQLRQFLPLVGAKDGGQAGSAKAVCPSCRAEEARH